MRARDERRSHLTRRALLRAAAAGTLGTGIGASIIVPGRAQAAKTLKILQWVHFVPRYDREWFDRFALAWGAANGVDVTVDHIQLSQIEARASARVAGVARGHDLIEWVFPPARFEPRVLDLTAPSTPCSIRSSASIRRPSRAPPRRLVSGSACRRSSSGSPESSSRVACSSTAGCHGLRIPS